jgi:hypothetical protein
MNGPFIWLLPAGWAIHLVQHDRRAVQGGRGGGLVILRMVNEFGIARKVAAAIQEAFPASPAT